MAKRNETSAAKPRSKSASVKKRQKMPRRGSTKRDWRTGFLEELSRTCNVSFSAKSAGITAKTAHEHRRADAAFKEAWAEALAQGVDALKEEARRRAVEGITKRTKVYYRGEECGENVVQEYSDTLLIFLLKAYAPETFRETVRQEHSGPDGKPLPTGPPVVIYLPHNGRDEMPESKPKENSK